MDVSCSTITAAEHSCMSSEKVVIENETTGDKIRSTLVVKTVAEFERIAKDVLDKHMTKLGPDESNVEDTVSELINFKTKSDEDAYNFYNDYAFTIGFSIRKGKKRLRDGTRELRGRELVCAKGKKVSKGTQGKAYTKVDFRTGCKAMVYFDVDQSGVWTLTRHEMVHNHKFCPVDQRYLLRSHRKIDEHQLAYYNQLVNSGITVSNAIKTGCNFTGE